MPSDAPSAPSDAPSVPSAAPSPDPWPSDCANAQLHPRCAGLGTAPGDAACCPRAAGSSGGCWGVGGGGEDAGDDGDDGDAGDDGDDGGGDEDEMQAGEDARMVVTADHISSSHQFSVTSRK